MIFHVSCRVRVVGRVVSCRVSCRTSSSLLHKFSTRPARNNAEVAIAIDNSSRSAPAAFNDQDTLEIARRIERDSGSNYRINGREVRARDVH